ncbi:MAG: GntR family transcriptional regulator [Alphaproteobacteria bacterium]
MNRAGGLSMTAATPPGMPRRRPEPLRQSDRAYAAIRRLIITCALRPGSSISEPELSQRARRNKAAVRAALIRLSQERLVTPIPRQGYRVAPLTIRDAQNILDLRVNLEPHAARHAAGRVSGGVFAPIRKQFRAGYDPGKPRTVTAFLAANKRFRVLIAEATGNDRLAGIIATLVDELERYLRISLVPRNRSDQVLAGHEALVEALVRGRAADAETICRRQMQSTRDMIMAALLARDEILSQPLYQD